MNLTVFQSDKGDCLMLSAGEKRMLIDGGMRESYSRHVAPTLGKLQEDGKPLDLVYVSHIDRDHVFGILQMMEDLVAWRAYDYHQTSPNGNRGRAKPSVKRPPEIGAIWHNAFHSLVGRNSGAIGDMLAANVHMLAGLDDDPHLASLGNSFRNLTWSMADAVELSRRVSAKQLNIPLNREFGGRLALLRKNQSPVYLGPMKIHLIGPSEYDLKKLRRKWNEWLQSQSGERHIERIRRQHRRDEEILGSGDIGGLLAMRRERADKLGRRSKVSAPNLASLMLLVESNRKTVLLTGDGHGKDILKGLEKIGKLKPRGGIHLDVLKVQHHGSENNINLQFCQRVTADKYVFCGNGAHRNPDLRVLEAIAKSRFGSVKEQSANPQAKKECTFLFNSSPDYIHGKKKNLKYMAQVQKKVAQLSAESGGKISYHFLESDKFEIPL